VAPDAAFDLWDRLLEAGRLRGLRPIGWQAIEIARIEAGFLLVGVDYLPADRVLRPNRARSPFELGFGKLVDFGKGEIVPYRDLLEEILELIAEDAEFFGCSAEVVHAREILANGTSAHQQIRIFREALDARTSREDALKHVVDWLIEETVTGL